MVELSCNSLFLVSILPNAVTSILYCPNLHSYSPPEHMNKGGQSASIISLMGFFDSLSKDKERGFHSCSAFIGIPNGLP
jgi:hypothetical protein